MKRIVLVFSALVGCTTNQPTERYGFVARLGRDTVSVESVTRRGHKLVSDEVDRFPRVRQRHTEVTLGEDGSIRRLGGELATTARRTSAEREWRQKQSRRRWRSSRFPFCQ
jgi:hypothetical protein